MVNFLKKLCCCLDSPEDDGYRLIEDTPSINQTIKEFIIKQDYNSLSQIEINDLFHYICNMNSIDHIVSWKLKDYFIIGLYKSLCESNKSSKLKLNYVNFIISRLVTTFLFFNKNYGSTESKGTSSVGPSFLNFISSKKELVDYKLWLDLLLNPKYLDDKTQIANTIYLAKNNLIPIYKPIKYYNLEYNIFELVLLGKMEWDPNIEGLSWVRFFELESIINFINQLNTKLFIDNLLINGLNEMSKYEQIDKKYIDSVLNLLTAQIYF